MVTPVEQDNASDMSERNTLASMIDVKDGMTFSGKGPFLGFALVVIGILVLVFAIKEGWILGLLLAPLVTFFGIVVFLSIRGTLIDPIGKRCRAYQDLLLFKLGAWVDIHTIRNVTVTHYRERGVPNELGGVAHINTYFVDLRGEGHSIRLKEVESRNEAIKIGERLAKALGIPLEDRSDFRSLR
ncbi:MAG: hypothetical protein JNL05_11745 [Flavobacteriales bacterium]|nr:hypothetical protein [Flavobacteriales bacterium]